MRTIQITHNDLDGYGAAAVAAGASAIERVIHVARYRDVLDILEGVARDALASESPVTILITDIAIEPATADRLASHGESLAAAGHRIVVLDHHASSASALSGPGWTRAGGAHAAPGCTVVIEVGKSATRIAAERQPLYASGQPAAKAAPANLVAMVDAVDLWRKDDPAFPAGMALNDAFWDCVSTYLPTSHPKHEAFVSAILHGMAALDAKGAGVAGMERAFGEVRAAAAREAAGEEPSPGETTRMCLARIIARDRAGFEPARLLGRNALVSFAMDTGIYQRASDAILDAGDVDATVNVMRGGGLSFRSRDGSALLLALSAGGGGHEDMAGAELPSGRAFSIEDALEQVTAAIGVEDPT